VVKDFQSFKILDQFRKVLLVLEVLEFHIFYNVNVFSMWLIGLYLLNFFPINFFYYMSHFVKPTPV
jgi:hypothetical protein